MSSCKGCIYKDTDECLSRISSAKECCQGVYPIEELHDYLDDIYTELNSLADKVIHLNMMINGLKQEGDK